MTREEMEELKGLAASMGLYDDKNPSKRAVILGKAIEALEQEPCENVISRLIVQEEISKSIALKENSHQMYKRIQAIPSVTPITPQQNVGKWMIHPNGVYAHLVCSKCLTNAPYDCKTNYCPNCGAKMEVE